MTAVSPQAIDLRACDREPIHVPSLIQPHGFVLVFDPHSWRVVQASANVEAFLYRPVDQVLGAQLADLFPASHAAALLAGLKNPDLEKNPQTLGNFALAGTRDDLLYAIGHRIDGVPVLELEVTPEPEAQRRAVGFAELYPLVQTFIAQLQTASSLERLCELASKEVRRITGFDRVLVYRFDTEWNGTVIAEDRNEVLPSYLDLRFPASDIPAQARELYRVNRLRLIVDADYTPVPVEPRLHPASHRPLDMSFCVLRSVSPVHLQYMRNMGTASSMSISILRDGNLWGLISCHSKASRHVAFEVRAACDLLCQVLALQIGAREHTDDTTRRIELKGIESRLLSHMAAEDNFVDGLIQAQQDLLQIAGAEGAAIVYNRDVWLVGRTPDKAVVKKLAKWLASDPHRQTFHTDALGSMCPADIDCGDVGAGLLAISISELYADWVIWFRPEVVQTVKWGGDPRKPVDTSTLRLDPRKSFEMWKETVRGRSLPWEPTVVDTAADLRKAIVGVVLRRAEELAGLTQELERSNKDLEAFSYSVSHDLRAPFRHIVGYSELLREQEAERLGERGKRYIETIIESAQYAGKLVDNLLSFSRMNRTALQMGPVDLARLVEETRRFMANEVRDRRIEWRIAPLPTVTADLVMLRLVFQNLLSNAAKYSRGRDPAIIEVGYEDRVEDREWVFFVRDNGIGFDMAYKDKLFGVFQRLHRMEDFEGTGIGLANVRRIIARHGGNTWAEGAVDRGATFSFSLPKTPGDDREHRRG